MFRNRGGHNFQKQFPNLKQVVNDQEFDFNINNKINLKFGENVAYLIDENRNRTVYTTFDVDKLHNYQLHIEYNYEYINEKIRKNLILIIAFCIILIFFLIFFLAKFGFIAYLVAFVVALLVYYFAAQKSIATLGIKAYKIVVIKSAK